MGQWHELFIMKFFVLIFAAAPVDVYVSCIGFITQEYIVHVTGKDTRNYCPTKQVISMANGKYKNHIDFLESSF